MPYSKKVLLLAFWYSFAVSIKLSAVFLIVIPLVIIFYQKTNLNKKFEECTRFFGYAIMFFILINIRAFIKEENLALFIQGTTANFWHYAVGHTKMMPAGWPHAKFIFDTLKNDFGVLFYLFVPAVFFSFFMTTKRGRVIKATILFILLLSFFSFIQQRIYLTRNIVPFYIFFLLLVSTSLWEIYLKCKIKYPLKYSRVILSIIMATFIFDRSYALQKTNWGFYDTINRSRKNALISFEKIKKNKGSGISYSVGLDLDMKNHRLVENVPLLSHRTFPEYLREWRERVAEKNTVIIVRRVDRNFQLTNFVLPEIGLKNRRFGDYFIFYHESTKE